MKYLILIGDGMADQAAPPHYDRTPLEVAETPGLDAMAQRGLLGQFRPIPATMPAGSEIGILSMFGFDPTAAFRGRAPMEAANRDLPFGPEDLVFRCNFVHIEDGRMASFTAGHITSEESAELVAALNDALAGRFALTLYPGVGYRQLGVLKAGERGVPLEGLECTPPHNIPDEDIAPHLPSGPGEDLVREIMLASHEVMDPHPVNQRRRAAGQPPATQMWLWGQGTRPHIETYDSLYGLSGAVISAVDLVNGIGKLAGFEVIDVPGATGWIDTNYAGKWAYGAEALARHDVVVIHVEAPDETAHQGRHDLKVQAITDFDTHIVSPAVALAESRDDVRLLAAPDHFTLCSTKKHAPGLVPFCAYGAGIAPAGGPAYTEGHATATGVVVPDGHTLVQRFLREPALAIAPASVS